MLPFPPSLSYVSAWHVSAPKVVCYLLTTCVVCFSIQSLHSPHLPFSLECELCCPSTLKSACHAVSTQPKCVHDQEKKRLPPLSRKSTKVTEKTLKIRHIFIIRYRPTWTRCMEKGRGQKRKISAKQKAGGEAETDLMRVRSHDPSAGAWGPSEMRWVRPAEPRTDSGLKGTGPRTAGHTLEKVYTRRGLSALPAQPRKPETIGRNMEAQRL